MHKTARDSSHMPRERSGGLKQPHETQSKQSGNICGKSSVFICDWWMLCLLHLGPQALADWLTVKYCFLRSIGPLFSLGDSLCLEFCHPTLPTYYRTLCCSESWVYSGPSCRWVNPSLKGCLPYLLLSGMSRKLRQTQEVTAPLLSPPLVLSAPCFLFLGPCCFPEASGQSEKVGGGGTELPFRLHSEINGTAGREVPVAKEASACLFVYLYFNL